MSDLDTGTRQILAMPRGLPRLRALAENAIPKNGPSRSIDLGNPCWGPRLRAFRAECYPEDLLAALDQVAELRAALLEVVRAYGGNMDRDREEELLRLGRGDR
jgi:hypothetical protein